ncbi:non-structural maintenance of chromosomes element 4 homolog A-like [Mizuhopecten yessoensis]|uniref:Non-structural maintenance of chromosomes element 4 n=1 Tax=Mizuhopecten yessoensis TaxID=6573 RepID=A0A210R6P3_MIZYE|nr:non-structural maintenance of chromosomes element 4 homolog A-like [Mizuhopecten yessoensis]OWF56598.1 Non-structural maintenance of chromosomes element 4-like A [Mizuhopecten yessoensis]
MAGNEVVIEGTGEDDSSNQYEFQHGQFNIQQSKEERKRIREGYRVLIDDLKTNRQDFVRPSSNRLDEALTETDELYKNVKKSTERVLDSLAVRIISNYGRQTAEAVQTDFVKFIPEEFAEKLVTFIGGQRPGETSGSVRISGNGWAALGRSTQKLFCKSPPLHIMSGTFQRGEFEGKKNPIIRCDRRQKENETGKATVPKKVESFDDAGDVGTSQHIARVLKYLQDFYEMEGCQPLCYFDFVLDPDSFGHTVENIFHTSFLVSRGFAKISLDNDKLPQIEPIRNEEEGERPMIAQKNHQTIISITPADWKELVEVFGMKRAAISRSSTANAKKVLQQTPQKSQAQPTPTGALLDRHS